MVLLVFFSRTVGISLVLMCARLLSIFFVTGRMSPGLNSNPMILIPKVLEALCVEQYRPIGLKTLFLKSLLR